MKNVKRFILSLILSKNERVVIWNSLWFSNHTYRRRGNVDGAASVQVVMNRLEKIIGVTKQTFTHGEVRKIVKDVIKEAAKQQNTVIGKVAEEYFEKGVHAAQRQFIDDQVESHGAIIDLDDCEKCESKGDCVIYNAITEIEKGGERENTESEEKPAEQAPEQSELTDKDKERARAEDDGVNYEKE